MIEVELPSGRSDVVISDVKTGDMAQLYNAQKYDLASMFVGSIQKIVNVDVRSMYLEDFRYLLAMIDRICWISSHRTYEWQCVRPYYVTYDNERHLDPPVGRRYDVVDCGATNTEEVPNMRMKMHKWRTLPYGMVHPTVERWLEAHDLIEDGSDKKLTHTAMWADSDLPLAQTVELLSIEDLAELEAHTYVACELTVNFTCNRCLRKYQHSHELNFLNFLRAYSDQSMMTMMHDIAVHRSVFCPDDMSIKKLLYWHGLLVKEMQKRAEDAALAKSKGSKK